MKIGFGLGHPAHFHLYKNIITILKVNHQIEIYISDKDVLKKLLELNGYDFKTIAISKPSESIFSKAVKLFSSTRNLYKICKIDKPDLFVSCLPQLIWVSRLLRKKNIFNAEDDFSYTFLQGLITYPFVNTILTSKVVKTGPFKYKQIGYPGYHKLAYLHPKWFLPDSKIKLNYIKEDKYFIIRIVNQKAYHDLNAKGLDYNTLTEVINFLEDFGKVYISSEKELPPELIRYQLIINENEIHHVLYFASLFIGDSQSMTVESAMLGIPSIRINNFANKISIIKELEYNYELTYSIRPDQKEKIIPLIKKILKNDITVYKNRREQMLSEKIDVSKFVAWFIDNYPMSVQSIKENPDFNNFR